MSTIHDNSPLRNLDPASLKTVAECIAASESIVAAIIRIDSQLSEARDTYNDTGTPADSKWFRNDQSAKRML